jgi:Uncharacterised protein family (UPF0236)
MMIRAASHRIGGRLLEKLLHADGGRYQGPYVPCGQGHKARFVESRNKQLLTVLAPVEVQRAYYYCKPCGVGVIPKDRELDIVFTGFSPGVRRMMGQVGGKEAFAEGREDLEVLAGLQVNTKAVERVSEALGAQIEEQNQTEQKQILLGKVVCLASQAWIPNLYVAIDGSGVPVVARETEGRQGKDPTGKAKTREAKLGCVFTQTTVDEEGYAVRDEESTTYVGAIEEAEVFGRRIYAEAVRRGLLRARRVIVLGDGAKWIRAIVQEHFAGAIQIVDLYHAREHLKKIARLLCGSNDAAFQAWISTRLDELDEGKVEAIIAAMSRRLRDPQAQEELETEREYFHSNAERMRYGKFRRHGLFVGSGVVEAGCKIVLGQRLKLSGMHWTVRGANAIIALR